MPRAPAQRPASPRRRRPAPPAWSVLRDGVLVSAPALPRGARIGSLWIRYAFEDGAPLTLAETRSLVPALLRDATYWLGVALARATAAGTVKFEFLLPEAFPDVVRWALEDDSVVIAALSEPEGARVVRDGRTLPVRGVLTHSQTGRLVR